MGRHSQLEADAQAKNLSTEEYAMLLVKQFGSAVAVSRHPDYGYPASTIDAAWRRRYTKKITKKVVYVEKAE